MRWLKDNGALRGRVLDFGCGHGFDARHYGIEGYDRNWCNTKPEGKFDTVTCIYVLNVLSPAARAATIAQVMSLLKKRGTAYFVVRRDKLVTKGQYVVELDMPQVYKRGGAFVVYMGRLRSDA